MTTNQPFQLIAQTLPGLAQPDLAIAAGRAGGLGILDLTYTKLDAAQQAVDRLARYGRAGGGVRLDGSDLHDGELARLALPAEIHTIILSGPADLERVRHFQMDGRRVWLEVTSLARARQGEAWGVDGLVAKGQEAGGWIGEETTFILLQRLVRAVTLPVYAQGGIGLHTIAAVYVAGAAGAILDSQLALLQESRLPNEVKKFVLQMDGSETIQLGSGTGHPCRMVNRPGAQPMEELRRQVAQMGAADGETWQELVGARVGWGHIKEDVWLLGQDAAFAKGFAERFFTVRGVFQALWDSLISHSRQARQLQPLQEGSPLAQSHGTRFPIVQGPMTRVSDRAEFALQIAEGGGLPFLALALMRAPEVEKLLRETQQVLGRRPWGIGILGFVPAELRQEQLEVALRYRPPFAIIAGGRPDQALQLEKAGIQTYLHVPSPGLLELFLQDGARRFIFEGRECGGHIGPRSSFVLWETMVEAILKHLPADADRLHVLFAGGIHDALSASMVATLAAPLAAQGAKVGVLLGTGYLFTQEAVESGAILPNFQQEALSCDHTVTVESGPGHAIRCVDTPFTQEFSLEKRRMLQEARPADEIRETLDRLNIGRLRIAAKGVNRLNGLPEYVRLSEEEQHRQGMFMIGQLAALRQSTCTIAELHQEVALGASRRLAEGDWAGEAAAQANQAGFQTAVPTPQPSRVAIIGIECLLPQADDHQTFWENVLKG
ncbi:MAG: nitronate monooxygenase, partial [Chloroflexota bacterium]